MDAGDLGQELEELARGQGELLLIAAHPDDDVIGAGALLARLSRARVVYVTDGAPRDGRDARAHGFADVAAYATARCRESEAALALAGIAPSQIVRLGVPDQQATFCLDRVIVALGEVMRARPPRVVLTHAYEGGHPDHDATAFAVHAAVALLPRVQARLAPPSIAEFAGYRAGAVDRRETSFLPRDGHGELVIELDEGQQRLKTAMFACHASQAAVLAMFGHDRECFRRAPRYDFARPPHDGPLLYERAGSGAEWGMTGARWRAEATAAARRLTIASCAA